MAITVSALPLVWLSLCVVVLTTTATGRKGKRQALLELEFVNPVSKCERFSATRTMMIVGYIAYEENIKNRKRITRCIVVGPNIL